MSQEKGTQTWIMREYTVDACRGKSPERKPCSAETKPEYHRDGCAIGAPRCACTKNRETDEQASEH